MDKINEHFKISHFECDVQDCPDLRAASRWAWKCLEDLAAVFCECYCDHFKCNISDGNIEDMTKYRRAISKQKSQEQWEGVQKQLHEAMAYLPELARLTVTCPACAIAEAFSCFPLIIRHSPRSPVATVKMNGIDCYPDVAFYGGDQRASVPCVVIKTEVADFEWEIEERLRESALLVLDASDLPPMPPSELEEIKRKLLPGQNVVRRLDQLRNRVPTQEELKENNEQSNTEAMGKQVARKTDVAPSCLTEEHAKDEFVLERREVDDQVHWIVNGEDKGPFYVRSSTKRAKIINILYNQIGVEGWVPHETFINACGWNKEKYLRSSDNPGCMQRQLTDIRNFLGVNVEFRKNKGVRFAENVVKSE